MKLIIKNGEIVTPEKSFSADILCEDGIISRIADSISAPEAEIYDAAGRYVFAGGIDVHTHLNLKLGDRQVSDGFYHGTLAAAHGGNTVIIDHPEAGPVGCSLHHQPEYYKSLLEGNAVIDYGVHGVFQHVTDDTLREIPELVYRGIPSIKVYTTYGNMLRYDEIAQVTDRMACSGGLTAFHAEDDAPINELRDKFGSEGKLAPVYHAKSRPDTTEADAIKKILRVSGEAPVYIVHLSTAKGLEVIREAKARGRRIYAETCPQYLTLTEEMYNRPDGIKYIMAPPLRAQANTDALWRGLSDGAIDTVATDHCSFSYADKVKFGSDDFRQVPGGAPGVETRIPILFSEGVLKGRITINRFTELISENPAKLMGLYPRKGMIKEGSDADFFILDKNITKTVKVEDLHQKCDYTPWEGYGLTGWPAATVLRGEVIIDNGKFKGGRSGLFLLRKPFLR